MLLWHLVDNPFPTIAGFLAALAVVVVLLSRATWRPAAPLRLARRRTWGQVITSAGRMYVTRWRLFLGIGVLFLPISLLITVLQAGVLGASSIAGIEDEGQAAGAFALIVVAIGTALTRARNRAGAGGDRPRPASRSTRAARSARSGPTGWPPCTRWGCWARS